MAQSPMMSAWALLDGAGLLLERARARPVTNARQALRVLNDWYKECGEAQYTDSGEAQEAIVDLTAALVAMLEQHERIRLRSRLKV